MRLLRLLCCAAALAPWVPAQPSGLTLEQKESFLRSAKITKFRPIATGITGSHRATLDDGTLQHDAHIQSIDEFKAKFDTPEGTELNFRDSYKFNIAAYELAKMLDLADMVPPSVQRRVEGFTSAVTWWVDDVLMDEAARMKK